jgi:hypothetical protein
VAAILRGPATTEEFEMGELDSPLDSEPEVDLLEAEQHEPIDGDSTRDGKTDAAARESPISESPPAMHVAALLEELHEKDALVAALTAQLEEAANRLDRLHRAGADRFSQGSSFEPVRTDGSTDLAEQVARLSAAWDELRTGAALADIGRKLDEIYDSLSRPATAPPLQREVAATASPPRAPEPAGQRVAWEDMKAQLLREEAGHDRKGDDDAATRMADANDSAADILSQIPLDPPAPIDVDDADRETLVAALEDRDVFISHLIRRLRSGPTGRYEAIDWSAIAGAPNELRERLQELEARLQELLRMEECDLSLERARLARERARLEQLRRDVERDTRAEAGGLNANGDDTTHSERRWLRAFGFGRREDRRSE